MNQTGFLERGNPLSARRLRVNQSGWASLFEEIGYSPDTGRSWSGVVRQPGKTSAGVLPFMPRP